MAKEKPPPGKPGRPAKELTTTSLKTIVNAIAQGMPREYAARMVGVSGRTLARWLAQGSKARTGLKCQLCREIGQAEALFIGQGLKAIRRMADGDPDNPPSLSAWTWLLTRRFPATFGDRGRTVKAEVKAGKGKSAQLVLVEGPSRVEPPEDMP